jgi:hypothetical protein
MIIKRSPSEEGHGQCSVFKFGSQSESHSLPSGPESNATHSGLPAAAPGRPDSESAGGPVIRPAGRPVGWSAGSAARPARSASSPAGAQPLGRSAQLGRPRLVRVSRSARSADRLRVTVRLQNHDHDASMVIGKPGHRGHGHGSGPSCLPARHDVPAWLLARAEHRRSRPVRQASGRIPPDRGHRARHWHAGSCSG